MAISAVDPDKHILTKLLHKINFLSTADNIQVLYQIEQELAEHFEFQVTCIHDYRAYLIHNTKVVTWQYYIRTTLQYPNKPVPTNADRLIALKLSIELLLSINN